MSDEIFLDIDDINIDDMDDDSSSSESEDDFKATGKIEEK